MAEWAVIDRRGDVVNIINSSRVVPANPYPPEFGYEIVPIQKVSHAVLKRYRYWNERP